MKIKMKKKGFTLVEMLFVMIIISLLTSIAIPNIISQIKYSNIETMKNDAQGIREVAQIHYRNYFNYNEFENFQNDHKFEDTDNDGKADKGGVNNDGTIDGIHLGLSKDNIAIIYPKKCNDSDEDYSGYTIEIKNPNSEKKIYFDSCVDSKPHLN
jgi:prepilin-type N-terminal cleavage/methylation domain-containing protein